MTTERGARIVFTTFGSLGDLHPYLALGGELKRRGHAPVIATSETYRERVESKGIEFAPVRPDLPNLDENPEMMARLMNRFRGSERIIREWVLPLLPQTYEDTAAAAAGADLLVSHPLTFATRLVAEKQGKVWLSTMLAPLGFFSAYDPPVLPPTPAINTIGRFSPTVFRWLFPLIKRVSDRWVTPWHEFRKTIGLPAVADNPLLAGQHSPHGVLALFSPVFAAPQPDWPPHTVVTGFPTGPVVEGKPLPDDVRDFLQRGPAPLVFTLGSAAVQTAGPFYRHGLLAAQKLHQRALLIVGQDPRNRPASLPEGAMAVEYLDYRSIFPHASVVIHQGGIGTTAEALRSGRPMLVAPFAHDQPDNAARVTRLGVARSLTRWAWQPNRIADELKRLIEQPQYAERAAAVAQEIRRERGIEAACDEVERVLRTRVSTKATAG